MRATSLPLFLMVLIGISPVPETPGTWLEKGQEAYETKNYTEAVKCFTEAIALDKNDPNTHYQLGSAYFAQGDTKQAANHFYQAGLLFLKNGDKGSALRAYTMLRKTNSKKTDLRHIRKPPLSISGSLYGKSFW